MMEPRVRLYVLDRGFVVIGRAELDPELAFHWLLKPGRTVRRWGTTKGLAELRNGPLRASRAWPKAVISAPLGCRLLGRLPPFPGRGSPDASRGRRR